MSTPMRHAPSQQGRTPSQHPGLTPQASTPFSHAQAALSPHGGHRSSPQHFKKSPAAAKNSPATMGTSGTIGTSTATLTNMPTNPPVGFDSPSAAALGALAMNEINLDSLSMTGLVPPPASNGGRADEDEQKRRLDDIIKILWDANTSRVSDDGLERLAKHLELEVLWEGPKGDPNRMLIMAGSTMSIEIGIKDPVVHHAALAYGEPVPILEKHIDKASAILKKDLSLAPNQSPLTKYLTHFKANLQHLTALDKLSSPPTLNCHEAIGGLFESLERLHKWDTDKLQEMAPFSAMPEDRRRVYSLCTRHGCPQMHARGRVGLSLHFWKSQRKMPSTTVDSDGDVLTWSILIGCGPLDNALCTPIRVSDKWLGPNIEKANPSGDDMMGNGANGVILDWHDPETILLSPADDAKPENSLDPSAGMSGPRPPNVVFMGTFDPPITVTQPVAGEIFKASALHPPMAPVTFDVLLFPVPQGSAYDPSEPRTVVATQTVNTFQSVADGGEPSGPEVRTHKNTLHIYKPVYGYVLKEIPFSHPREIMQMLPQLRQFAFLSTLLNKSFKSKTSEPANRRGEGRKDDRLDSAKSAGVHQGEDEEEDDDKEDDDDMMDQDKVPANATAPGEFAAFLAQAAGTRGAEAQASASTRAVDMTLTVHPVPRLQIVFPFGPKTANIMLEIQPGGRVHIISDNVFEGRSRSISNDGDVEMDTADRQGDAWTKAQWASALETCEDVGIWIEFIKARLE